ncbi:MAG: alkaline phosphatase family protein [Acidobacteria bacterium]|jgi:predicted AlkP superfamily pyrophosphatase or phosphodiesterase|nr:alkaline phosphatase family protein [Acidobacteriota bacterium]
MPRKLNIVFIIISCIILFIPSAGCCGQTNEKSNPDVRLVVAVVIDQLPAEMVTRLENRFGRGGFRYLINNGVWYKNARYPYVTTLTAVGHATLFTGALPSDHGVVGNSWLDRQTGKSVKIVDPTVLTASTIGDELVLAFDKQSRVFGVSLKDRAAVLPAGHLGKAFWYNEKNGEFQTSDYYYKQFPGWFLEWNKQKKADQYKNTSWTLLQEKSKYISCDSDNRPEEKYYNEPHQRTAVFPHPLDIYKDQIFYYQLCFTPFADDLTVEFACNLLEKEKLGQGKFMDMLIVSLSATDVIGHAYGPDSLEYEDNLLHVDASLEKLFKAIDRAVGLKHSFIVVASDHGGNIAPETLNSLGMTVGRINPKDFETSINQALQQKYHTPENFVFGFRNPSIYLNLGLVEKLGLDMAEVERISADAVMKINGIAYAVTRSDLLKGNVPDTPMTNKLKVVFHPKRSGNILIYQESSWFLYHVHDQDLAMHGSPYTYDTHVPVFFAGSGIKRKVVYRDVSPLDIAVTVALRLGIEAPSAACGTAMTEVFD